MRAVEETFLTCRRFGCTAQATEVVVTILEGFCFERCAACAEASVLWPPRPGAGR